MIQAFLDYLEIEKKYSPHTVLAYKNDLERFERFCKEVYEVDDLRVVSYVQVRAWVIELVDSGISNRSVNRKTSSLRSFYNFLQKTGDVSVHPLAKHKSLKMQRQVHTPFTEAEVTEALHLLGKGDDFEAVRNHLIVSLFYATGIRRSELIGIQLESMDLVKKTIKIKGKRNKERLVLLLPFVEEVLDKYLTKRKEVVLERGESPYLFLTKRGVKVYETLVYRIINSYFSRVSSKVKKSPHMLRHAFATHLLNHGASLNSVKELLGHESLAATQVYTHNDLEEIKKVFNMAHPRGSK